MKSNSGSFFLSIILMALLSTLTAFGQTNTTGTNLLVTITAPDPVASEAGDPGLFRVSRGTNTSGILPVFLLISGTALNGTDYQAISNRVLIADGETSVSFAITPIDDAIPEPTESVTVRVILPPAGFFPYRIGSPNTATVNITDDDGFVPSNQPPVVNIVQPSSDGFFFGSADISIKAVARDTDGTIASVEFFVNNQSVGFGSVATPGNTSSNLYSVTWSNVPPGGYDLVAKATDNEGAMAFSPTVHIFVGTNQPPPPTNLPPIVNILQPTNGASFRAPTNILIRASARDSNGFVASVEFFANDQSLGFGRSTNSAGTVNGLFFLTWSNVPPGGYDLVAKATDNEGAMAFSPLVHIFVGTNQPPPPPTNNPPLVSIVQPTNNAAFLAPANIAIRAVAWDIDGFVASVEFFANNQSLGFGSNINPDGTVGTNYFLTWNNVGAGGYDLTAKATDDDGAMRISPPVHILVGTNQPPPPTNQPPVVSIFQPTNGVFFLAPANIPIRAIAHDIDGFVASVEFFANDQSLGFGRSTNSAGTVSGLFFLTWSNVPQGAYDLTAKATDDDGAMRISSPVHIFVGTNQPPPTDQLAVVSISATDPTASEGLVVWCSNTVVGVNWLCATNANWHTNWPCPVGTNTATFTVRRSGETNHSLRVYYSIGGSASNGVDYESLSGVVTIPPGARAAHVVMTPIDDTLREGIETVVLRLRPPLNSADTPYAIGLPRSAAAYIADNDCPPPPCGVLADGTVHLCSPFTNLCFRVELSTNLVHWEGICTNRVADGAAHHLDPDAANCPHRFFRFIPVPCPPDDQ